MLVVLRLLRRNTVIITGQSGPRIEIIQLSSPRLVLCSLNMTCLAQPGAVSRQGLIDFSHSINVNFLQPAERERAEGPHYGLGAELEIFKSVSFCN